MTHHPTSKHHCMFSSACESCPALRIVAIYSRVPIPFVSGCAGMSSNPIHSYFCWHTPKLIYLVTFWLLFKSWHTRPDQIQAIYYLMYCIKTCT